MWLIKFILKIPAVVFLAVVSLIVVMAKLAEKISSFLLGLVILIAVCAVVWCFWQGRMQDGLVYFGTGVAVILLLFAIEAVLVLLESLQEKIGSFIHS